MKRESGGNPEQTRYCNFYLPNISAPLNGNVTGIKTGKTADLGISQETCQNFSTPSISYSRGLEYMKKQLILSCLFLLMDLIYHSEPSKLGEVFRNEFFRNFKDFYAEISRKEYLKAVAVISNFRLRNKLIGVLDFIVVSESSQIPKTDYENLESFASQFNWILIHTDNQDNLNLIKSFVEKCRKFLSEEEFEILFLSNPYIN